jgi:hypothetical protein
MTQATVDALLERFGVAANVEGGEPSAGIQSANFPTLWNYLARMQKPGRMEQTQQQQQPLDLTSSGVGGLSPSYNDILVAKFRQYDTNADGTLSKAELEHMVDKEFRLNLGLEAGGSAAAAAGRGGGGGGGGGAGGSLIGTSSKVRNSGMMDALMVEFGRMDTSGDGLIDANEFPTVWAHLSRMKARESAAHSGGGGGGGAGGAGGSQGGGKVGGDLRSWLRNGLSLRQSKTRDQDPNVRAKWTSSSSFAFSPSSSSSPFISSLICPVLSYPVLSCPVLSSHSPVLDWTGLSCRARGVQLTALPFCCPALLLPCPSAALRVRTGLGGYDHGIAGCGEHQHSRRAPPAFDPGQKAQRVRSATPRSAARCRRPCCCLRRCRLRRCWCYKRFV